MTIPDVPYGENYQPAAPYDPSFGEAVLPEDVAPYLCEHDEDPPVCVCVHDWRINWGNLPKRTGRRATYLTGMT
jgi:hypothetical protein